MTFADRCRNAFLGLALGDAYGRPLEFLRGATVRTCRVDTSALRWTDDTHMSLYLAEAVLEMPEGPLDDDRFGNAVARAFDRWERDPITYSTAPGNTCLAGVRRWRAGRDWRTSGIRESDGCGAVMRIAPLAMRFSGEELARAARFSALVTHAHPNALDAAEVGSVLLRACLEGGPLDRALIASAVRPGVVGDALKAALDIGFDEDRIPAGDGGWRSPSALGLAVAAAIAPGDFAARIDLAARIDGDSDSVAAIAGMYLGAAGVPLPESWLAGLQDRARIESLALDLCEGDSRGPVR